MLRNTLCLAALALGAGVTAHASAGEPLVVASIKPVHSLVAGVMEGVGEPVLLVKGAGSEHSYSLRPSEARALERAAVVFWVGETLETFLIKPLRTLSDDAQVVELAEVPGLTLHPTREGGTWEAREHEEEPAGADAGHEEGGHEAHGETDMHVWLDPRNAEVLVDAIAGTLGAADPANAARYAANAARLRGRLEELDRALAERLAAVADRPYVVFHDAYQYFERRYGTHALGAITINPIRRPGAQRLGEIHARLAQLDAACVFAEPQFEPALVETVVEGTDARQGVLDPLGAAFEAGPGQYFRLMEGLADALLECLKA